MLYMPKTATFQSTTRRVEGTISDEGSALVVVNGGVQDSAGTAGEKFAGFAQFQRSPLSTFPRIVDRIKSNATTGEIQLDRIPVGGTLTVRNFATSAVLALTTDYTYDAQTNKVTMVDPANRNVDFRITFEYSPSVMEARVIQGDIQPGGTVPPMYSIVGVLQQGDVFTSRFDTTADWTGSPTIRLGANGKLTTSGSGAIINAYVIAPPTGEIPFLGICLQ